MEKQCLLFISSLIIALTIQAQETDLPKDSVDQLPLLLQPSIYIDYGKLTTIATEFETKYEGAVELTFLGKFPVVLEVGQATLNPEGAYSNGIYQSEGIYWRVGAGYVGQFKPKNKIGLSVRYASSTFSETGLIRIESPSGAQHPWERSIRERDDLNAAWYELVFYTDRQLTKLLSLGLNIRFRILADYDEQEVPDVYSIPGYGRSFEQTVPAANFFLKVTF